MPNQWLNLVVSLTGKNQAFRMRLWRQLKAAGAGVLRDGVYLLPQSATAEKLFTIICADIENQSGIAYTISFESSNAIQQQKFLALFDRSEHYHKLLAQIQQANSELDNQHEAQARKILVRLRNELQQLQQIDFFPDETQTQTEVALNHYCDRIENQFSPHEPVAENKSITSLDKQQFQNRLWATRKNLWVDRVASAWLIKTFIDPHARFVWLEHPEQCPADALGFDFNNARFTHVDDYVSFEVLMHSFDMQNIPGMKPLAEIIHYLDVGGIEPLEAKGLEALILGARENSANDDVLLTTMSSVFDCLLAGLSKA
ncbi:MAG: chromate resistance protein [Gammaproteobacteria bacterium]|nr:chromate resistance protein [Gammaproteobacteria bacterium]